MTKGLVKYLRSKDCSLKQREPTTDNRQPNAGFTMIEIIIAIGILAAMMVSVTEFTTNILNRKVKNDDRMQMHHTVSVAVNKITDDLRMAFIVDSKFQGKDSVYKTGFIGEESRMDFSTMSNVHFIKNKKDTDQIHVGYVAEKNEKGHLDLKRRQTDYLEDKINEGGHSLLLIKNMSQFALEYYDSNKEEWKKKWDTESISAAGKLPQIVKIKVGVLQIFDEETEKEPKKEPKEHYYEFLAEIPMYNTKISF
ncbi:prepilin-type N-terminal cleavage/methylation domain-containing protein [bacterium]|nr:prepilin-type N-terminal cleavage/methylation domain-containing protein [bacterium]